MITGKGETNGVRRAGEFLACSLIALMLFDGSSRASVAIWAEPEIDTWFHQSGNDPAKAERRPGAVAPCRPRVLEEHNGLLVARHRAGGDDAGRSVARMRADHGLE